MDHIYRHPLMILVFLISLQLSSSSSYAVPDIIGRDKCWVLNPNHRPTALVLTETPAPSAGAPVTTLSLWGQAPMASPSEGSAPSPSPLGHVSEVASTKGSSTIKPPASHTTRTSISPSIASEIPSSSSPTSPLTPSSNTSPAMSPQGSRRIPSSSPTSPLAPLSNTSPATSPQGSINIAPSPSNTPADIPSGLPPKSNSAIVMAITPTVILASTLSLSISVALQELFTIYR